MLFYYLYTFPKCNTILDLFCKKEWFWIIPRTIFVGGIVGLRTKNQLKQDIAKARAEGEACAASTSNVKQ